jgi:thioesterase domain-containing protein
MSPGRVDSGSPPLLTTLRAGEHGAPLYLFPGMGGDGQELLALVDQLASANPVIGVDLAVCFAMATTPQTVKSLAHRCAEEIQAAQASGPYYLVGYSFGGLVAAEVASLLRGAGQEVGFLVLIDAFYDQRFWPAALFLKSQARRVFWHLKEITSGAPDIALKQIGIRTRNLLRRVRERFDKAAARASSIMPVKRSIEEQCISAIASHQPSDYPGQMIVIGAEADDDFGCSSADLWRKYCKSVRRISIPGSHLGLVRTPESISRLAAAIDSCVTEPSIAIARPKRPRVLVISAFRWPLAAHVARSFHDAGATVDVLCPEGQDATLPFVNAIYRYPLRCSLALLRQAIVAADPDLLIPCDDPVASQLHQIYEADDTDGALRALLARSLGNPDNFRRLYSRVDFVTQARELDVPCPNATLITDIVELRDKLNQFGFPAVLKVDETWGGMGVAIVRTAVEAERAFARLRAWPGFARGLKRLLINKDATLLRRVLDSRQNVVSLHKYIDGRPANAAVACWNGKVLAAVLVEVLESDGPTGPATVMRVVAHPGMSTAVERMVEQLRLSGLCGFDFILRAENGEAVLIELNPRATPACRLPTAEGRTLSVALCNQWRDEASAPAQGGAPVRVNYEIAGS